MAEVALSQAEKIFILHGVQENLRTDGRQREDYRYMELETDLVSNTNGSARIRLTNTDILVGVKAEVGEPDADKPKSGRLEFFVDCSANAAPEFEGRGGEDLASDISATLQRAYKTDAALNLESLCIIPGSQCWVLYVDIVLLECGGNLVDAASIAVKAALYNTRIPNLTVTRREGDQIDVELSDDPFDCQRLDVTKAPCVITLFKIGHCHVVDASMEEEACSLARVMVAVTEHGTVTEFKIAGNGSLDPLSLMDMIESGKRVGQKMNHLLHQVLQEEEKLGSDRRKVGFLG